MYKDKGPDTKIIKELILEAGRDAAASVGGVFRVLDIKTDPDTDKKTCEIDVYIEATYGYKIPAVSWDIQSAVKARVKTASQYDADKIDIHIQGVGKENTEV